MCSPTPRVARSDRTTSQIRFTRRGMFGAAAGATLAGVLHASNPEPRKKVAFLATEIRKYSHAQHILDRLTSGYGWAGEWISPPLDIASIYVDQFPEQDLATQRIERHSLRKFDNITDALTLGGTELAVDGVVIIGEHGDYPRSEKGQKLYPRYKWFKEVVRVFEKSGRAVPVFNDKHLSTKWSECVEMADDSKRLGFPFLAGSSLPVTWRLPSVEMPWGADLRESVCVAYGGMDSYDFHALETAQCMSERRKGGEVGIRSVQAFRDAAFWNMLATEERATTQRLILSALSRSHSLPEEGGFLTQPLSFDWARKNLAGGLAYCIEHLDGFRTTIFMTNIRDFNYAGYRGDTDEVVSCQMYLPMPGRGATTADFFNPLSHHIEAMVLNSQSPYPIERTLLTSGMVIGGVESVHQNQKLISIPDMRVAYQAPRTSTFWSN